MEKLTDSSPMPFGKFKGDKMINVPASYLLWIYDQHYISVKARMVNEYIKENMDVLRKEIESQLK